MTITGGAIQNNPKGLMINDILQKCQTQSGWSGAGQEYISAIRKQLEDPAHTIKIKMQHLSEDAVVFFDEAGNALILVNDSDIVNLSVLSNESKLFRNAELFYNSPTFKDNKLLNMVTCNKFMFDRPSQMANYISMIFTSQTSDIKDHFNVNSFGNQYSIGFDTDMANVRQFFDSKSVSPIIAGNFGFIANLNNNRTQANREPKPLFGVTGNVEFIRNDQTGMFTPIVRITDILTVVPSSKIFALVLPLIAEVVISRSLWKQPFTVIGRDTGINIGNLVIDANSQKPYEVKTDNDFRQMFREYIDPFPILCIDIKSGGADIPGIQKLISDDTSSIYADIMAFFNEQNPQVPKLISQPMFKEIIGGIATNKTKTAGGYLDTRDFTYLYAVSQLKYNPQLEYFLTRNELDPIRRFDRIRELFGDITPTHVSITALLQKDFLTEMVMRVSQKMIIDNFQSADVPAIDMSKFAAQAYQPGITLFGHPGQNSLNSFSAWSNR